MRSMGDIKKNLISQIHLIELSLENFNIHLFEYMCQNFQACIKVFFSYFDSILIMFFAFSFSKLEFAIATKI